MAKIGVHVSATPRRSIRLRRGGRIANSDVASCAPFFARNLRKARHARRLSQEALAYEAGVDYVSALDRGVYNATIVMVAKLAKALDVEPSALLQRKARFQTRNG